MPFPNITVKVIITARPDGIDEIGVMFRTSRSSQECRIDFFSFFSFRSSKRFFLPLSVCFPCFLIQFQITFSAIKHIADFDSQPRFSIGKPASGFKLQYFAIGISKQRCLGIGRFLRTFPWIDPKNSTDGRYKYGVFVLLQPPSGNVKLMRSLVASVPIAGIPMPVPVVMTSFLIIRSVLCWTEPHIVMQSFRRTAIRGNPERI